MTADELDHAYALLSQAITRVPRPDTELFLARLALLLVVASDELSTVVAAIEQAEAAPQRAEAALPDAV